MKKSKRTVIAKETLATLKKGYYINKEGREIDVAKTQKAAVEGTKLYKPEAALRLLEQELPSSQFQTEFVVNNLTTLNSVRQEYPKDNQIVCLNFASARNPGGGFLNGSQAQEESVARATGLYPCLLKSEEYYLANRAIRTCLYTDNIIYSPAVPVLKYENGELMDEMITSSIITAPAVNTGVILRNEPENIPQIEPRMKRRIDMVLAICQKHQYKTLVLGAWGCGVFRNDPEIIAGMFQELLFGKYRGQFKRVVFSIYSKNERFILPFQEKFTS